MHMDICHPENIFNDYSNDISSALVYIHQQKYYPIESVAFIHLREQYILIATD